MRDREEENSSCEAREVRLEYSDIATDKRVSCLVTSFMNSSSKRDNVCNLDSSLCRREPTLQALHKRDLS